MDRNHLMELVVMYHTEELNVSHCLSPAGKKAKPMMIKSPISSYLLLPIYSACPTYDMIFWPWE
jgi:hypothetical protein